MTKISKTIKDQNPETYGYGSPEAIPGNEDGVIHSFYVCYEDFDGDYRYYKVSEEIYKFIRNEKRKEDQFIDRRSRCVISSEKYGTRICPHKCDECPFGKAKRKSHVASIEYLKDKFDFEFANRGEEPIPEKLMKEERIRALEAAVSHLEPGDKLIIKLFKEGKSDSEIAKEIGKSRSATQYRREKIFESLREQLKDF